MRWLLYSVAACSVVVALVADAAPAGADQPKSVSALVRALSSDDVAARRSCAAALGERWPDGARSVPALLALLDDEDASVRAAAAKSVESLGERGVAPLAAALGSIASAPADRAFLEEMLTGCEGLGPALTFLDTAACATMATTPGTRRVALVLAAAFDSSKDGCLGADSLVALTDDAASGPLAAAVIALQGATAARRRGAIPPGGAGEAPAEIRAALRSSDRSQRVLATRLLVHLGRCGPQTRKDIADALGAECSQDPADDERGLLDALAFACGAAHAPTAELTLRSDLMENAESLACVARGICEFASVEEAVALLQRPFAASTAAARIARLPVTPAAAEPALRRMVRQDAGPDVGAAVALADSAPEDAQYLRGLDDRAARLRKAGNTEDALRVEFAAYCLAGQPGDRLAALRTRAADADGSTSTMAGFAMDRGSFLLASRKGAWLMWVYAESRPRWLPFADALQSGPAALVPRFAEAAGASRVVPTDKRHPFVRAVDETLLAAECARAIRALEQVGPAAAAALPTLDTLRADPDPRVAVPAARAARAIRRK